MQEFEAEKEGKAFKQYEKAASTEPDHFTSTLNLQEVNRTHDTRSHKNISTNFFDSSNKAARNRSEKVRERGTERFFCCVPYCVSCT